MPKFDYMQWQKAQPRWVRDFMSESDSARRERLSKLEVPRIVEASPPAAPLQAE